MKKFLAVLCIFATLFTLASCKIKKELTPEEELSILQASQAKNREEQSKQAEASIKHEEEIYQEKQNTLDNLGKTEKGKQIVFMSNGHYVGMKEGFEVIKFNSNQKFESWIRYIYYPSTEAFNRALSDVKTEGNFAYETSDASMRVIVYRYTNEDYLKSESYDTLLKNVTDFGYTIIE